MNSEARQDLPLDLVVLADLGFEDGSPAMGRIRRLESDGLAAWLAETRPGVTIESGGGSVTLSIADPRGFRPESIAPQLPEARALLELRERLTQRGIRVGELNEIVAGLAERSPLKRALSGMAERAAAGPGSAPPSAAATPPAAVTPMPASRPAADRAGDLDALFEMVDTGDAPVASDPLSAAPAAPSPATSRALDRLVHLLGIGTAASGTVTTATQQGLAAAVDEALGDTIRPVLRDPRFQALEQTWTGLRFLMRRLDHRSGVRVHVLPVRRAELAKRFREVFAPFAEDQRREARVPVAIVDFDLGAERELESAADLCAAAAAVHTPILAGLDPAVLGIASFEEVERVENLAERLTDADHTAWNALRARDASRWLVLAANRFLLRIPYGREHDRVKGFVFEEHTPGASTSHLWGRATWILAERIAASFARCGWGVELTGQNEEVRAGDLSLRLAPTRTGESVPIPLEALLSERTVLELADQGILALACRRDGDYAFLASAPVLHGGSPADAAPRETRRDSLRFAMFDAQVSAWAAHLEAFGHFGSREERGAVLAQGISRLATTRAGPTLETRVENGVLRVAPWREPLRGLPELELPLSPQR